LGGPGPKSLNRYPLNLIERDPVAGAVVKLSGARAFVRCHGLRVFERAAGIEVGSDAGGAKYVAAQFPLRPASAVRRRTIA
jgi:hypothetical protein